MVELMVAMSIASFLIAGILGSYTFLGRNVVRYSNQQQLEAQSRKFLQMFSHDVHLAANLSSFSPNSVALLMPDTTTVTYTYTPSATSPFGTLTRTDSTGTLTLVTGITSFGFTYLDQQGVTLSLSPTLPPPFRIKQIEVSNFTATNGTGSAGTLTQYNGASARYVLRNKYLIPTQNGQSY